MDAWTILMLGGAAAIWAAMLSAVAYVVHARAWPARGAMRAEGFEPPSS